MINKINSCLPYLMFIIIILSNVQTAISEDKKELPDTTDLPENNKYGFLVNYNYNMHSADFRKLPNIPNCCPRFENGTGSGFTISLLYEMPLSKLLFFDFRAGFSSYNGRLSTTETTTVIVNGTNQTGEFEHSLDTRIADIGLEAMFGIKFFKSLKLSIGLRAGYNIIGTYDQVEKITKPVGQATFMDSLGNDSFSMTRNEFSDDIPDLTSLNFFAIAGIGYELPLDSARTLLISPEIFYSYGLTPVIKDLIWNINNLRFGIAFIYNPQTPKIEIKRVLQDMVDTLKIEASIKMMPDLYGNELDLLNSSYDMFNENYGLDEVRKKEVLKPGITNIIYDTLNPYSIIEKILRKDTLYVPKKAELDIDIEAFGIDTSGIEIKNPTLFVEEFISSELKPLLNYIFFDENSYEIPTRYNQIPKEQSDDFTEDKLYKFNTLNTYYSILNVIGSRLKKYPKAKLTIVGCNADIGVEKGNKNLSLKRATTIKNYLTDIWNINESRLEVLSRNLPQKSSNPIDDPDKSGENRRVEFYSDIDEILDPVYSTDTLRTVNPPIVRFYPMIKSTAGIKSWHIAAVQQTDKKNFMFDTMATGKVPLYIDWNILKDIDKIPTKPSIINYALLVEDSLNQDGRTEIKSLPVEVITIEKKANQEQFEDKRIDKFSLILFDFDKYDISGRNQKIMNFIKDKINNDSKVKISGYTDRTGDIEYNKNLSTLRAKSAANALSVNPETIIGVGSEQLLFNNDLPEGRFLCRTVIINVETPVK